MEIFFDSKRYDALFNCSSYRIDDVPFEQRQNPLHAICLCAMRNFLAHSSAYKVMFLMGLGHICCLSVTALLTGIFSLIGAVFCSLPILNFFAGSVALFSWALTTSLSVLLALERCAEQTFPNLAKTLFAGRRIWGWILAVLAYSIYYGFFTIPLTFSGLTANWQFDPHVGYLDNSNGQNLYWNSVDVIHTIVVAIALPTLYLLFVVMLSLKLTQITKLPMAEQKMRKSVFVQVFVLSSALTVFAVNYTLLNFVSVPDIMVSINMYLWVLLDGVPPLIYLSLNASIRAECLRILRRRNSQQKLVTTFGRHSRRTHLAMGTMNEFMPTKMIVNNFVDSHI
uniref:G_PROTEIN_RECEP_F1_2 domain-containing protein n=1 Tax=Globodera pallida TaxID=36090 RepID=A0A183C5F8_GLOPA